MKMEIDGALLDAVREVAAMMRCEARSASVRGEWSALRATSNAE